MTKTRIFIFAVNCVSFFIAGMNFERGNEMGAAIGVLLALASLVIAFGPRSGEAA